MKHKYWLRGLEDITC